MQAVMEDLRPDAIKIGMTGNVEIISEIARLLHQYSPQQVVPRSGNGFYQWAQSDDG